MFGEAMPSTTPPRSKTNSTLPKKPAKKASRTAIFSTKTIGRWIYVYDQDGKVIRQIMRPFGKTRIPLAQIRENVRKVIAERLAREAERERSSEIRKYRAKVRAERIARVAEGDE